MILVNTSNPAQLAVAGTLDIPGTVQLSEIAVDGNYALVVGNTGGFTNPVPDSGNDLFDGNVTLTLLDISNPDAPTIVGSTLVLPETLPTGDVGSKVDVVDLGNGVFAVSNTVLDGTPQLLVVGTADPTNLAVAAIAVPAVVHGVTACERPALRHHRAGAVDLPDRSARQRAGDRLGRGRGPAGIPARQRRARLVQHRPGPDDARDQLRHRGLEPRACLRQHLARRSPGRPTLDGLAVGETRVVGQDATVDFVSQATSGTIDLPSVAVTGTSIVVVDPGVADRRAGGDGHLRRTPGEPDRYGGDLRPERRRGRFLRRRLQPSPPPSPSARKGPPT